MIEFLQDYETKAIPPEVFKKEQRVERSEESELYFVRLGVAAYVVDGQLVDLDYKPIQIAPLVEEVVTPGDRRFALGGRAGELPLGIDAPQRATTGPGNAAVFGGDQQTAAVEAEVERLGLSVRDLDERLLVVSGERDTALTALAALTAERDRLAAELQEANAEGDEAVQREQQLRSDLETATTRGDDLSRDLAEARERIAELEAAGTSSGDDAPDASGKATAATKAKSK